MMAMQHRHSDRFAADLDDETELLSMTSCETHSLVHYSQRLEEVNSVTNSLVGSRNSSIHGGCSAAEVTKARLLNYYVRYVVDDRQRGRHRARSVDVDGEGPLVVATDDDLQHRSGRRHSATRSGSYRDARTSRAYSDPPGRIIEDDETSVESSSSAQSHSHKNKRTRGEDAQDSGPSVLIAAASLPDPTLAHPHPILASAGGE